MIAVFLQCFLHIEQRQKIQIIILGMIIMPLKPISMNENHTGGRHIFIIINEERQVRHSLMGSISGYLQHLLGFLQNGRGIDIVDTDVIFMAQSIESGCITIGFDAWHDERGLGGCGESRAYSVGGRHGEGVSGHSVGVVDAGPGKGCIVRWSIEVDDEEKGTGEERDVHEAFSRCASHLWGCGMRCVGWSWSVVVLWIRGGCLTWQGLELELVVVVSNPANSAPD